MTMDNIENSQPTAIPTFAALAGLDAGVESEACSFCAGFGRIYYNPNLNPNSFPDISSAKCTHCGGTGSVEKSNPQPNDIQPTDDSPVRSGKLAVLPGCACVHHYSVDCARIRDGFDTDDPRYDRRGCECVCHARADDDDDEY
jgi:hypothetical protein